MLNTHCVLNMLLLVVTVITSDLRIGIRTKGTVGMHNSHLAVSEIPIKAVALPDESYTKIIQIRIRHLEGMSLESLLFSACVVPP